MKKRRVRAIALCVFWRGDAILVAECYDRVKEQPFYRPLGGTIEVGEYGHDTVARELREEIGAAITGARYLATLENIFTYEGDRGHEIVLMYEAELTDRSLYEVERIDGREHDAEPIIAVWQPLAAFQSGRAPLYPDGLWELLTTGSQPATR